MRTFDRLSLYSDRFFSADQTNFHISVPPNVQLSFDVTNEYCFFHFFRTKSQLIVFRARLFHCICFHLSVSTYLYLSTHTTNVCMFGWCRRRRRRGRGRGRRRHRRSKLPV